LQLVRTKVLILKISQITSGTSHGHGSNDAAFNYGGLPHKSIFEQLSEKNISWINYSNSSGNAAGYLKPGQAGGFNPDSLFYNWTWTSGAVDTNVKGIKQFYADAEAGNLPQFTYINPECCSFDSMHPPSPISLGENFIKGIYEALRNSPQWNQTLFILSFDEGGGFADHVAPPVNVPAGDSLTYTEKAADGKNATFDFSRLGVRVPTMLISPWVGKGVIENKGSNNGGIYTHSSIPGFLAKLWDLENLTPRTAWSATFEHLFQDKLRTDTPAELPPVNSW
jgi:phospholipase C